jgi:hypothetical protein
MIIKLKNVRLLYGAAVFTPQRGPNGEGEPKHSATFGFAKDHPAAAAIKTGFQKIATDKWGAKAIEVFTMLKAADKLCLHDGDAKADKEGFKGNLYVSASNKLKPMVVDGLLQPLDANSGKPYSGCFVNAEIELWAQDNKFGKRINASLRGIQFVKDGPRLSGGGVSATDAFEAIPEEAGEVSGAKPAPAGAAQPNPFD